MHHDISYYQIFKNEGLRFGWKNAKKHFWFFVQVFVLLAIANALPELINWLKGWPRDTNNIGTLIAFLLSLLFGFGMIKLFLHFAHQKIVDIKDLWDHDWGRFAWWILARIVTGVLIALGMILLIIPGLYVAARLYLVEYFVVDQDMTAIEAVSASREVTKGHVWEIIGIRLLSLGIIILGAIPLGIGLLWAIPTIKLAQAKLYTKLTTHAAHLE